MHARLRSGQRGSLRKWLRPPTVAMQEGDMDKRRTNSLSLLRPPPAAARPTAAAAAGGRARSMADNLAEVGGSCEERPDFVLALHDVSTSLRSRARRLLFSVATLGMLRSSAGDINEELARVGAALEASGFCVLQLMQESGGEILVLLRGTEQKLQREFYREQLDIWIQSRTSAQSEFTPRDVPADGFFTPARRVGLLHAPLLDLLPQVRASLRADLSIDGVYPVHHRRFCATLLAHLCRRPLLQAQHLHAVRSEYGEKVAFLFAFRSHQQRWLRGPALVGVLLWLSRFVSATLPALLTPLFGLAVPIWSSLLLEGWRVRQRELATLWAVDELREAEVVRPEFRGEAPRVSFVTGEVQHYPSWRRALRRWVAVPVLGVRAKLPSNRHSRFAMSAHSP